MKQLRKIFLLVLMVASVVVPSFSTSMLVYAGSPATVGAQITISNMPTSGEINTSLNIPKGSSDLGTVITTIKDPKNVVVFDSSEDTLPDGPDNTYVYNPLLSGTYKVQYFVITEDDVLYASTYSKEYNIVVAGTKPVLDFENNSTVILPETTNYDYLITIPYPTVTASNGEEVSLADVASNISITVKNPLGETVVLGTTTIGEISYKTFTPAELAGEGVYTIDYYYADLVTGLTARKAYEMEVDASFDATDIKLGYTLSGSMPESAIQGNEVTLPTPVTRDQNSGNSLIRNYTLVTVTYLGEEGNVNIPVEDFTFTPAYEGEYEIVYKVYNYYSSLEDETLGEYTYTISEVKDTEAPQVEPVQNYTEQYMDDENYNFVNVAYNIPSNVAVGSTVTFPAIHATDNFNLSSELTYKRAIINANNTITDLDHATNNQYTYYEGVPYTFLEEGTYTVKYYATDEAGNERTVSYTLKVVDGFLDNEAPRITMPNIANYVRIDDTIKFLKPTAVDYVSTTSTSTVDTRLEVKTFFYVGDDINTAVQIFEDEEDSNYLSFVVPDVPSQYITIYVEAKDDGMNNSSGVNIGTKTKKVYLLDITDTVSPSKISEDPLMVEQNQGTVVNIPTIKVTDDNPSFTVVTVEVKDKNDNKVNVSGLQIAYEPDTLSGSDADGVKVVAGKFTATLAGWYSITYTATDIANNSYVISFLQFINDTEAPTFNVSSISSNIEIGETITLPTPVIMDNGEEIGNEAETTILFIDSPSYNLNLTTYEFTPLEEGVYSFKYLAEDLLGNTSESAIYSMTASDTIDPIIILNDEIAFPITAPLTRDSENDPYDAILIPDFTAYDEFNGVREFSVTVKNPSGSTILDAENGDTATNGTYSFVPTKDGTYTVTYSVTDLAGNKAEDIKTVRVGDTAAPVLTIGNVSANKPGNKELNETITLDLSAITIADVKDGTILTTDTTGTGANKFTVVLTAPDGSTVSQVTSGTYSYNLTQSGDYTLTYTVRDEAGNEKVESTVFQVSAEEAGTTTLTETLGIVFIIIAVLALAGVVIYFIKSREIVEE